MLTVFVATFVIFALVILGMSLGYLIKRKSIQGSCGGISSLGMEKVCDCPEPCDARKTPGSRSAAQAGSHPINSRPHRAAFLIYQAFAFAGESTITPSAPSSLAVRKSSALLMPKKTIWALPCERKQSIASLSQVSVAGDTPSPSVNFSTTSTLRFSSRPYQYSLPDAAVGWHWWLSEILASFVRVSPRLTKWGIDAGSAAI